VVNRLMRVHSYACRGSDECVCLSVFVQIVMCVVFIACSVHTIHISIHTSMDGLSRDMSSNWTSTVVP